MNVATVLQELEQTRAAVAGDLTRLDAAIAALRGNGAPPAPSGKPNGKITAKGRGAHSVAHLKGKRDGRSPKWDVAKGAQLWKNGVGAAEIADRLGTTAKNVSQTAVRKGWPKAKAGPKKCKGCGSTVGADRDSCPACGIPA